MNRCMKWICSGEASPSEHPSGIGSHEAGRADRQRSSDLTRRGHNSCRPSPNSSLFASAISSKFRPSPSVEVRVKEFYHFLLFIFTNFINKYKKRRKKSRRISSSDFALHFKLQFFTQCSYKKLKFYLIV